MARSPSAREVSRCGALGPGALGEFREGFSGHGLLGELPGGALGARPRGTRGRLGSIRGVLPAGYSGTRVVLAGLPDVVYGLGTRGQVASSATSGGSLSRGTRGQVSHSEAAGEVSLAGLAMHSGASGRLAAHSELPGTRGAFGGFRVLSLGDFTVHSGTSGGAGVVGTRGTWPSPKDSEEGSGEGFEGGTR